MTYSKTTEAMASSDSSTRLSLSNANRKILSDFLASFASCEGQQVKQQPARTAAAKPMTVPSPIASVSANQLPAFEHRLELLRTIGNSQVTLIRGATGCGKSTQLPKLLLLQAAETKTTASIVVAQPRRLAAMALAERVSSELGEDGCGGLVGYRIRGEARVSSKTVITFTTTGLLLRQLEGDPNLESISHLIVDEVHERNVDTDLLLLVLRRALAARTTRCTIVLMSATVAAEPFVEYFASAVAGGSAQIGRYDIPGRAFAVEQLYLEDALAHTGYVCGPHHVREKPLPAEPTQRASSKAAAEAREAAAVAEAAAASAAESGKSSTAEAGEVGGSGAAIRAANLAERATKLSNAAAATSATHAIGGIATEWLSGLGAAATAERFGAIATTLRAMDLSVVNEELVHALVARHHAQHAGDGAVLVFVPGVAEIERVAERLERRPDVPSGAPSGGARASPFYVVRLHSQLSSAEQRLAFARAPPGQTKVVVATDIAETSLTIDDVTLVIDGGLHRAPNVEPRTGIMCLRTARISLAAAKQRAGRAGRVRAGVCYHLFCRIEATEGMANSPTAEILRVPLEGSVLRLHGLLASGSSGSSGSSGGGGGGGSGGGDGGGGGGGFSAAEMLAGALEPPDQSSVRRAVDSLVTLGALARQGEGEVLLPLGARLARLPTEPGLAKCLLTAQALGCSEALALLIAGFESAHDPFGRRTAEAGAARRALDASSCHLALLRAHAEWAAAADDAERRRVVDARGVNGATLRDISSAAARLLDSIGEPHGRRPAGDAKGGGSGGGGASDAALAKACLLTGGAALVTRASGGAGRPIELLWKSHKAELMLRPHAATVLGSSAVRVEAGQLCVTLGAMRSPAGLVAHDVTLVTPLAVLLFGPRPAGLPEVVRAGAGLVRAGAGLARAGAELRPGAAAAAVVQAAAGADGGASTHGGECALGEEANVPNMGEEASVPNMGEGASVAVELAGAMVTIPTADARLLAGLRMHLDAAVASEGARGGATNEVAWRASLSRVVGELMGPMDVPWAGLPEGWRCEADAAGAPLFRSLLDPTHMSRQKPTMSAARFAASAAAAKGSLQRANEEHEAKRLERAAARAKEAEAAALAAAARQVETREEEEARARAKAEEAAADRAAEAAQLRAVTMARAAAAEKAEASARRSAGVAGSLYGGVAKLLAELELADRYAGAFAAAGYDNAALLRIAEAIDEGKADGTGEGLAALEKMIEAVGLRGGSAVKVRKRLTEPPKQGGARGGSGSGGGKGGGGEGGGGGSGGGGGGSGAKGKATGAKGGRSVARAKEGSGRGAGGGGAQ